MVLFQDACYRMSRPEVPDPEAVHDVIWTLNNVHP